MNLVVDVIVDDVVVDVVDDNVDDIDDVDDVVANDTSKMEVSSHHCLCCLCLQSSYGDSF